MYCPCVCPPAHPAWSAIRNNIIFAGYRALLGLEAVIHSGTPHSFHNRHFFSAVNPIASTIIVFIASLGVVRLTAWAAAKIDKSKWHNSLIPWKLLFSVWSYVSFLSPLPSLPPFAFKGQNYILFTAEPRTWSLSLLHAESLDNPLGILFPKGISWLVGCETLVMEGGAVQPQGLTFPERGPL